MLNIPSPYWSQADEFNKQQSQCDHAYYTELDQAEMLEDFDWSDESIDEEFTIIKLMETEN